MLRKYLLTLAFVCVLIYEIRGWWLRLQFYAGIVEWAEEAKKWVGEISFSSNNVIFVLERLDGLIFPYYANVLFVLSFLFKCSIIWFAIFRYNENKDNTVG
jgi:hypothetical protein